MSEQEKRVGAESGIANPVDRRAFLRAVGAGAALATTTGASEASQGPTSQPPGQPAPPPRPFLTTPASFGDVSRGNPRPYTLTGDALTAARLTPATWRLEIVSDGTATIATPRTLAHNNAIDLPTLQNLGEHHGRRFLKAMQCLNIAQPLGQGLWEGIPLRDLVNLVGRISNVRRIYYWGFHNNDPQQVFQSSLSYTQVMEAAPSELGPFVAYRLNGEAIPLLRGGPVRMIVPWAHGFKSIKWLQRIILSNNYQANDTYHSGNNDFGFDPRTGQPRAWPMKYSWGLWSVTLANLKAGAYEFRARAVDNNDFAQPEPRPYPKSGRNEVQMRRLTVNADS